MGVMLASDMAVHDDLRFLIDSQMPLVSALYARGSFAPLAATLDLQGEVAGEAFTADDAEESGSVDEAIEHFSTKFTAAISAGSLRAAAIFFYGFLDPEGGAQIAHQTDEVQVLVVRLYHAQEPGFADAIIQI